MAIIPGPASFMVAGPFDVHLMAGGNALVQEVVSGNGGCGGEGGVKLWGDRAEDRALGIA